MIGAIKSDFGSSVLLKNRLVDLCVKDFWFGDAALVVAVMVGTMETDACCEVTSIQ